MSQRSSGYSRKPLDRYLTPAWVTQAVVPHLGKNLHVLEPASGGYGSQMAQTLCAAGYTVETSDIIDGNDFLRLPAVYNCDAIVTNPPYSLAQQFIDHALNLMVYSEGKVAMLLRCDYDHAITRQHLFANCPQFAKKLVLTKRIVWFEPKIASPSFNHAWFIWDWKHKGAPTIVYDIQPLTCTLSMRLWPRPMRACSRAARCSSSSTASTAA